MDQGYVFFGRHWPQERYSLTSKRNPSFEEVKVSLNFYSFNPMLNNGLRHRPNPITTLEVIDFAAENYFDAADITAYYIRGRSM